MNVPGRWVAVGVVVLIGALTVIALTVFTDMSETGLLWVGIAFGVVAGIIIAASQREERARKPAKKRR